MNRVVIGHWVAFTLYFGAAWADAEPWQREALRHSFTVHSDGIRDRDPEVWKPSFRSFISTVAQTMGPEWQPKGEWAEHIESFLKHAREE